MLGLKEGTNHVVVTHESWLLIGICFTIMFVDALHHVPLSQAVSPTPTVAFEFPTTEVILVVLQAPVLPGEVVHGVLAQSTVIARRDHVASAMPPSTA